MIDLVLTVETVDLLNEVLNAMLGEGELSSIALINKSGRLMCSVGATHGVDPTAMAALVSASFASTKAIANMVGEEEFSSMYQQGQKSHIYITLADENTILVTIFDDRTTLDIVKFYIRQYNVRMKKILVQIYSHVINNPILNLDIGGETSSTLDNVEPENGNGGSAAGTIPIAEKFEQPVERSYAPVEKDQMYFTSINVRKKMKSKEKQGVASKLYRSE